MIIEYIAAVISAMIIDGIWLGIISKGLYQKYIGDLMLKQFHFLPAILFYLIFALAIVVFIASPAIQNEWGFWAILLHGALLGLVIYGGYDLTNLAILKGWSLTISFIDIGWGTTLGALASVATVYLSKLFIR